MNADALILQPVLDQDRLTQCFSLRREVFVAEQGVPEDEEIDQWESVCRHWLALEGERPVGTARWRQTTEGIKLERFAVRREARGRGIGSALLSRVIDDIHAQGHGHRQLYLHAQLNAAPIYARQGFEPEGEPFDECGIRHVRMRRRNAAASVID